MEMIVYFIATNVTLVVQLMSFLIEPLAARTCPALIDA